MNQCCLCLPSTLVTGTFSTPSKCCQSLPHLHFFNQCFHKTKIANHFHLNHWIIFIHPSPKLQPPPLVIGFLFGSPGWSGPQPPTPAPVPYEWRGAALPPHRRNIKHKDHHNVPRRHRKWSLFHGVPHNLPRIRWKLNDAGIDMHDMHDVQIWKWYLHWHLFKQKRLAEVCPGYIHKTHWWFCTCCRAWSSSMVDELKYFTITSIELTFLQNIP